MEYYKGGFNPIGYLENAQLSWSEITNDYPILGILLPQVHANALRKAFSQYQKWIFKRGRQMGEQLDRSIKANVSFGFFQKCMIDILVKRILGFYGLVGSVFLSYAGLAYKVAKLTKKYSGEGLVRAIIAQEDFWLQVRKTDPVITKVVCLASAKLAYYLNMKFSDISFAEEELEKSVKQIEEIMKSQQEEQTKP